MVEKKNLLKLLWKEVEKKLDQKLKIEQYKANTSGKGGKNTTCIITRVNKSKPAEIKTTQSFITTTT